MELKHFESVKDLLYYAIDILDTYSFYFGCNPDELDEVAMYLEHLAERGDKE